MFSLVSSKNFPTIWDEFEDFFSTRKETACAVDVYEKDGNYFVEASLPGFGKDDIKVDLDGDLLTISAERKEEKKNEDGSYLRKEIRRSSFKRSFNLSEDVDRESIDAKYENGILKLALKKVALPEREVKKIEIK